MVTGCIASPDRLVWYVAEMQSSRLGAENISRIGLASIGTYVANQLGE